MPERYELIITVWLDGNEWGAMVGEDLISGGCRVWLFSE